MPRCGPATTASPVPCVIPAFLGECAPMSEAQIRRARRIQWQNVLTVVSAAILISAEVFGAAFAGSWAIASLFALGTLGARILDGLFVLCGIAVMVQFVRAARQVEPFSAD